MHDPTGTALLAGVLADPADDTARLVFADWLQEQGDEARADMIRWMVTRPTWFADSTCLEGSDCSPGYLAALDWLKGGPADEELAGLLGGAWSVTEGHWMWHHGQLVAQDFRACYARGFVESVTCSAAEWRQHAATLTAAHPVTRVTLTSLPDDVDAFCIDNDFSVTHRDGKSVWMTFKWKGIEFSFPAPDALHWYDAIRNFDGYDTSYL